MTETLAYGYSSKSSQRELFNDYQHDRVWMVIKKSLHPCALDQSSLSIGRVNVNLSKSSSLQFIISDVNIGVKCSVGAPLPYLSF